MSVHDNASDSVSSKNVGASSTTDDRVTADQPTTGKTVEPRIEVMTLVQGSLEDADTRAKHDQALAFRLNWGWEILNLIVTTEMMYTVSDFPSDYWLSHTRIVTLSRLVEPDGTPTTGAEAAVDDTVEIDAAGVRWRVTTGSVADAEPVESINLPARMIVGRGITLAQATASGEYSREEIRAIAEHELAQAGLMGAAAWEPQQNQDGASWESLRFHLNGAPTPALVESEVLS